MPRKSTIGKQNTGRKAVIYARYSSHNQKDASIEQQVEACMKKAEAQKLTVVGTYADRAISGGMDTAQNLYAFAYNNNGTPTDFAKSRLYWLKLKQNGYVRKFQPVRLKNGLVGLWDFVDEKAYLPKNASGGFATFSAVGPETQKMFNKGLFIILR